MLRAQTVEFSRKSNPKSAVKIFKIENHLLIKNKKNDIII